MSSWQEELERLLAALGVEQEHSPEEEVSLVLTHGSLSHPGVFYRLELASSTAQSQLWVYVPADESLYRLQVYRVQLAADSFLAHLFALYLQNTGGSPAFQEIEGTCTYHLFWALGETMKALFWKGDLARLQFPPEIQVKRLL